MMDEFPAILEGESVMVNGVPIECNPVAVAFGMHYVLDPKRTEEAGHQVFTDKVFVKIAVPGDKNSLYFQPASDDHKRRFPKAWENFQQRQKGAAGLVGMPIEQWAPITRGMALTLKAMHIHTVEALAGVMDTHIAKLGNEGRALRAQAVAFLEQAKDSAATTRLAAEKEEMQGMLAAMRDQIARLQDEVQSARAARESGAVPAPAAARDDSEDLRNQVAEMRSMIASLVQSGAASAPQERPAEAPEASGGPEAARRPRGFQRRQETAGA